MLRRGFFILWVLDTSTEKRDRKSPRGSKENSLRRVIFNRSRNINSYKGHTTKSFTRDYLCRNISVTTQSKVLVELFQKLAGGGRFWRSQNPTLFARQIVCAHRGVTVKIRFGFATISNQGVALWRPYFTNKKRRRSEVNPV